MARLSFAIVLALTTLQAIGLEFGVLGQAESAHAVTVQPGESVQAAIDRAPEGAVVCLREGEWRERIAITKNITLRGEGAGRSVLQATDVDRHVLQIRAQEGVDAFEQAPHVSMENLTVRGVYGYAIGILVGRGAQATIADCIITECGCGIAIEDKAQATIDGCTISENQAVSDPGFFGDGDCISLVGSAQARIEACSISGNGNQGISLWETSVAEIIDCAICGNRFGIALHSSSRATIEQNRIIENYHYGVSLFDLRCFASIRSSGSVEGNTFSGYVLGRANFIPGPDDPHGNMIDISFCPPNSDPVCPGDLWFLGTDRGGELDCTL